MKNIMYCSLLIPCLFLSFVLFPLELGDKEGVNSKIQIAFLLDTSQSMDGLIDQAKSQFWKIITEITDMRKNDQHVKIEVALYEYGNDRLSSENGFIRLATNFTEDLDLVSKELFSLSTNGGSEYCGQVMQSALTELEWSINEGDMRLIYIAGNESFAQGPILYKDACALAINKDVVVNPIFCGAERNGINLEWAQGSDFCHGDYAWIDQNAKAEFVLSPYDKEIERLNKDLNKTYLAYGKVGEQKKYNQRLQDDNAGKYTRANSATRAKFKISKNYNNASWDLVDAYNSNEKVIHDENNIPQSWRGFTKEKIKEKVIWMKQERERIQSAIKELIDKREVYVRSRQKQTVKKSILSDKISSTLKSRAADKGFVVNKETSDNSNLAKLRKAKVDYTGFKHLVDETADYRRQRLVGLERFMDMATDNETIILDTRSERMYKSKHMKGALHLNFSDFSEGKLAKLIPNKNTRILIYCNNNISDDPTFFVGKIAPLALNLPTFVNLYGYGYKNIYELKDFISINEAGVSFEGNAVVSN